MLIILLYILLSLLAVSLWINIGLWREVKRLENKVIDLCLENATKQELAENNFRRGWNEGRFAFELGRFKSDYLDDEK